MLKDEEVPIEKGFFVEYFNYRDYVYSNSRKTELGDNVRTDMGLRYQFNKETFGRIRFKTDPVENRTSSKTSSFEILGGHESGPWVFQGDVDVRMDDGDAQNADSSGEISVGLDLDSELSFIGYRHEAWDFTFYPFNFNGRVGKQFRSWDVTRLYFIEGSPTTVGQTPALNEKIAQKTIPGVELGILLSSEYKSRFYVGAGVASYLFPSNGSFDVTVDGTGSDGWSRHEAFGWKAGYQLHMQDLQIEASYVGQTRTQETGALLQSAGALYTIGRLGSLILESEVAMSRGGERPYRLNNNETWFERTTPYAPVYSDYDGLRQQGWVGKMDWAFSFRSGLEYETYTPYISYKFQGKNFVYRERDSAHRLRTANESESHGGLQRVGTGVYFYSGNFIINPEFEWFHARNPVFVNATEVPPDRILADFVKDDYLIFLTVSYNFGAEKLFKP